MADVLILYDKNESTPMEILDRHIEEVRKATDGQVFRCFTEEQALSGGIDAEILYTWGGSGKLPEAYCLGSKKLKWLHTFSAGVDPIMKSPIRDLPISLTNAKGIHGKTMALTTLGYIISFLRGFPGFYRQQQSHTWSKPSDPFPREAIGLSACILGAGAIGSEVAKLCKAIDMRVIGVKRNVMPLENYDEIYPATQMDDAISLADFLIVLAPLSSETYHLVDAERIGKMKPTAILINISRGPVVDEAALIEALRNGTIAGAALDALEIEPLPQDSPLWDMHNVIITPHCSATSNRYMDRAITQFCDLLGLYQRGEPMYNLIDLSQN